MAAAHVVDTAQRDSARAHGGPRVRDDFGFPPSAFHFDGSRLTAIPIEGVVSRRTDPEAPVSLVSRGEHVWLYSSHRVWKLASEEAQQPAPVTF